MPIPNEIRDLVEQDRLELMMRCPFYGRIICSVELLVVSDPQVRLTCTDYSRIFISGDAYSALPEELRLAVLAHEVLHIALRHAFRVGDRNKNRFEKAADIEVTFILT
jgi:predicted metal-dependent peptidase